MAVSPSYQELPVWPSEKQCRKCGVMQPLANFHKDCKQPDGKRIYCRTCQLAMKARYNEAHRSENRASDSARRVKRIATGLCAKCGKPNDTPQWHKCGACRERERVVRNPHRTAAGPCVLCGFVYADVHHLDGDHANNDPANLIALCPNHHRLVHLGLVDARTGAALSGLAPTRGRAYFGRRV